MLPASEREPNGQPSRRKASVNHRRSETERDAMDAVVSRRIRHDNIMPKRAKGGQIIPAEDQAKDPMRGYVTGRLYLDGRITRRQHDAAVKYAEDMARYYGRTQVPFPSARAQDIFAVRGEGGEADNAGELAKAARARMAKLRDILLGTGDIQTGRRIEHTVKAIAVLDEDTARGWPEHMMLWFRQGTNKLADYYQLPEA